MKTLFSLLHNMTLSAWLKLFHEQLRKCGILLNIQKGIIRSENRKKAIRTSILQKKFQSRDSSHKILVSQGPFAFFTSLIKSVIKGRGSFISLRVI